MTNGTIQGDLGRWRVKPIRPNNLALSRAAARHDARLGRLDGQMVDYAPLDVHVGSIAVRRFIERCQPIVTLTAMFTNRRG
jgi:hypothetical protein